MAELLKLEVTGIPRAEFLLTAVQARAHDLRPLFGYLHQAWLQEETQQFFTQGAFFGTRWEPLNPDYAKYKTRHYAPPAPLGILYRIGRLFSGLTAEDSPDHVKVLLPDEAVFGTTVEYGKYHQTGTPRMPQRTVIKVREWFSRFALLALKKYLLTGDVGRPE